MAGNYRGYAKRYTIKPRFYVIIAVLSVLGILAIVALSGALSAAKIEWGRLSSDQAISAVVVRDEQVVDADQYGRLSCVAAESGTVKKGDTVAILFLSGYSDKDNASLLSLQNDIKDYQKTNIIKDTVYSDLNAINASIDDKMSEISADVIAHETQGLPAAEQDLKNYMTQRTQYMKQVIDKPDDALQRMYDLEATLQGKIDQTRKTVEAPADGLVSFYLDGYEKVLTVGGLGNMTPNTVKKLRDQILKGATAFQSADVVAAQQPIFRLVNPEKWYAVVVMNTRENQFIEGMTVDVTFDGLPKTVSAKVDKVMAEGGTSLAVLEVPEGVQNILSLRLVTGHLGQDIEGFRVPLNMLLTENGRSYIAIQGSGPNVDRIQVDVLGKDNRYAIVKETSGSGDLKTGLPLVKP